MKASPSQRAVARPCWRTSRDSRNQASVRVSAHSPTNTSRGSRAGFRTPPPNDRDTVETSNRSRTHRAAAGEVVDLRELLGEPHIDDQIDGYGSRSATTKVLRTRGQLDPNRVAGAPLCHACESLRLTRVRPPPAKGGSESRGVLRRWEFLPTPTAGARVRPSIGRSGMVAAPVTSRAGADGVI